MIRFTVWSLVISAALFLGLACSASNDSYGEAGDSLIDSGRWAEVTFHAEEWRGRTYCFATVYSNGITEVTCPPVLR